MFIFFLIFIGIVVIITFFYYALKGSAAVFVAPELCPVCGRKIKVIGKTPICYKCRSKLIRHADGRLIAK
ncbi:DUF2614 family zinc ribbon-containing protein [Paenibacillus sp. MBLB4367]|uniref:DUF2614 family zinc ribbon-containing protein n=1 Tax=Paenibacillus sp. MBLB4367 TaxID=3384767 RepID=UPI0039081FC7